MSESWDDICGAVDKPISYTSSGSKRKTRTGMEDCQLVTTAEWIREGTLWHKVTDDVRRILDAVDAGYIDRIIAAKFADENLGYSDGYLIRYGRRPNPAKSGIRPEWRSIPRFLLSPEEKALSDKALDDLGPMHGPKRMPT